MRLVLMQFVSLDGVCQGPGAPDEDTSGGFFRGGWFVPHLDEALIGIVRDWVSRADAFLFGRRTYANFARDWPSMPDPDDPVARRLNGQPKFVASNSLRAASWSPTTILSGDTVDAVRALKREPGRELQIHGSATFAHALLCAGVVDELRLVVAPVVVGAGRRLLEPTPAAIGLRLTEAQTTPAGLALQTYEIVGAARVDVYDPVAHTFRGRE